MMNKKSETPVKNDDINNFLEMLYSSCVFAVIALFAILASQTFELFGQFNKSESTSLIAVALGALLIILSLTLVKNIYLITDGILFGGIATLVYSVLYSLFQVEDTGFTLLIVTIAAVITLVSGYLKFSLPHANSY